MFPMRLGMSGGFCRARLEPNQIPSKFIGRGNGGLLHGGHSDE